MEWKPDEKEKLRTHSIEYGRWFPCVECIQFGTPVENPPGTTTFEVDHSALFFTQPHPFDWYIFGFGANWGFPNDPTALADTMLMISLTHEKKNLSTRFINAAQMLGVAQEYPPGYLPLQMGWWEITGVHKAWAWVTADTEDTQVGVSGWVDRDRKLRFVAPYMVPSGGQLRFQVQNRCDGDFTNTMLTVVGQRWLPWSEHDFDR